MVIYIIISKLNSAFSTIGKATADKITAKLVGKTHVLDFCVSNQFEQFFEQFEIWMFLYFLWRFFHLVPSFGSFKF